MTTLTRGRRRGLPGGVLRRSWIMREPFVGRCRSQLRWDLPLAVGTRLPNLKETGPLELRSASPGVDEIASLRAVSARMWCCTR